MSQTETGAAIVQKIATGVQHVGAGTAVFAGLTANEVAAIGGLLVAIVGLVVSQCMNWWFKWQHLKLARENAKASEVDILRALKDGDS
jgi:ABC-type proline/glycine betaine transport system permease subunit